MKNKEAVKLGKLSWEKRKRKYGPDYFSNIGKLGAKKRWNKEVKNEDKKKKEEREQKKI